MSVKILGKSLATAIAITTLGCETTNPYTGEKQVSKASKGSAIGALGGAVIGAAYSGKRKAVLLGAGTGSLELNQRLSQQRAVNVARYLASRKVLSERMVTRGLGPEAPIAANDTPEGRALNRRVEIV